MVLYSVGAPENIIPKPTGEKKVKGCKLVGTTYDVVCELTVTKGKTFHPAKITASSLDDFWVKLVFAGEDISIEYYVGAGVPFTNWFPWGWHPCVGDGFKKVQLQAKSETAAATTVYGEICGEEV
jgi:hypothetical protein